ncbi:MAG TPA: alpha-N-arabinofuranosidase [Terracidiphilus sp.]|jgi:alpha-N-arabinofuranosidase|nr:alpha-N-arabinofuranosidase [Terracidiphilus sp.]
MKSISRRRFLKNASQTSLAVAASSALGPFSVAQGEGPTRVVIDSGRQIGTISPRLYGSFLEHLGRAIYEGIYEPGSKFADANGFRTDVMKEVRDLGVPIVRYPGGNFVSGYHWLNGVGPKKDRPTVLDRAWNTLETNQFGTNEFITWARAVGTEPLFGLNFGTGTAEDAAALVEYCNWPSGTKWSELRRSHGYDKPHNVKYWCVGNEMDGPWQIGHIPAREYGLKATDAARQMRAIDPNIKLVACGSSGPFMPTYIEWDRTVLEQCYEVVDGISLHRYWGNTDETGGDSSKYLAMNLAMDRQIEEITAVCDSVRAQKRSGKQLFLSFDEWNVWYRARSGDAVDGHGKAAPHLLEEPYNLEDALLVGGLANSLMRHADRVKLACLAQLVNVIAPIMTNEDGTLRNTIYYPYSWALKYAHGASLSLAQDGPSYEVDKLGGPIENGGLPIPGFGAVPYLDITASYETEKKTATLFVLNRDLNKARDLEIKWHDLTPTAVTEFVTLTGSDLKALNTFADPKKVVPQALEKPKVGSTMTVQVPPRSYSVLSLSL